MSPARGVASRTLLNLAYTSRGGAVEHLDLYLPAGRPPPGGWPVILGLPGGGWRWVRRSDLTVQIAGLVGHGYALAVADYAYASSRVGTRVWPANFHDVEQAVIWLRNNSARFGLDPNRVVALGQSAGSQLAALLGTDAEPAARVQAVVDFYGPADLTALYASSPRSRPYLVTFLGGTPGQVPKSYRDASPVTHVAPGDPPFLIYQGLDDQAVTPTQSLELAMALTAAGVPNQAEFFVRQPHGFTLQAGPTGDLTGQIVAFLDAALNHDGQAVGSIPF
jgi:acetyl esterase/lipase